MKRKSESFRLAQYVLFALITLAAMVLSVCIGSVNIPIKDTLRVIWMALRGVSTEKEVSASIILLTRIPRVLCVALAGASLALCGGAMQGLLRNPLADGSTLGVSSGASLGAVIAIVFSISIPGVPFAGTMVLAIIFAFLSLVVILGLAYRLDYSMATNTIILIGVIFNMFASSILSLLTAFAAEKVRNITFWTMGSFAGTTYAQVLVLFVAFLVCGAVLLRYSRELNAFAIGEDNARNVGVNVKKVKLIIMIAVSALIGVSVSIGGTVGFVGLVIPHMTRMVVGPNHKRLMPACIFTGATFMLLADLTARVILKPLELPIGVITSLVGSVAFVYIFYKTRKGQ